MITQSEFTFISLSVCVSVKHRTAHLFPWPEGYQFCFSCFLFYLTFMIYYFYFSWQLKSITFCVLLVRDVKTTTRMAEHPESHLWCCFPLFLCINNSQETSNKQMTSLFICHLLKQQNHMLKWREVTTLRPCVQTFLHCQTSSLTTIDESD